MDLRDLELSKYPKVELPELHDDFMFKAVMSKREICIEFLQSLLGLDIEELKYIMYDDDGNMSLVESIDVEKTILQDAIKIAGSHGVRVDLLIRTDTDKVINIEMQSVKKEKLPKRVRYYQSAIDRFTLSAGQGYNNLLETYIIFVCNYDPFDADRPFYRKGSFMFDEDNTAVSDYKDGSYFVALNAAATTTASLPVPLQEFLSVVHSFKEGDIMTTRLGKMASEEVSKFREMPTFDASFRLYSKHSEELKAEGREEGRAEGRAEGEERKAYNTLIRAHSSNKLTDELFGFVDMSKERFMELYRKYNGHAAP